MGAAPAAPRDPQMAVTLSQHVVSARITAARIGRLAAQVEAGDFDLAHVRAIYLALEVLTVEMVKIGDAEQCAARHEACNGIAAREAAA